MSTPHDDVRPRRMPFNGENSPGTNAWVLDWAIVACRLVGDVITRQTCTSKE
jgi:hypothetical protein